MNSSPAPLVPLGLPGPRRQNSEMMSGVAGGATTLYWKTVAQPAVESVQGKQLGQAPELANSSSPPPECHAPMMYLTVVPEGCGGMAPVNTSTIWHPCV